MTIIDGPAPSQAEELHGFEPVSADASAIRQAFGQFPSGVAALAASVDGTPTALVASSFSVGVSFDPPMVMFSIQNSSTTWPVLRTSSRVGVSILGSEHGDACMRLASRKGDRFAGLDTVVTEHDSLFIHGSTMWLDCEIISETPAGDHHIVVLEVKAIRIDPDTEPLVYHGATFRALA